MNTCPGKLMPIADKPHGGSAVTRTSFYVWVWFKWRRELELEDQCCSGQLVPVVTISPPHYHSPCLHSYEITTYLLLPKTSFAKIPGFCSVS